MEKKKNGKVQKKREKNIVTELEKAEIDGEEKKSILKWKRKKEARKDPPVQLASRACSTFSFY